MDTDICEMWSNHKGQIVMKEIPNAVQCSGRQNPESRRLRLQSCDIEWFRCHIEIYMILDCSDSMDDYTPGWNWHGCAMNYDLLCRNIVTFHPFVVSVIPLWFFCHSYVYSRKNREPSHTLSNTCAFLTSSFKASTANLTFISSFCSVIFFLSCDCPTVIHLQPFFLSWYLSRD